MQHVVLDPKYPRVPPIISSSKGAGGRVTGPCSPPAAPAAGADGAGPVPCPAPPLLLHRGDAAPLPSLPHPAGVRHRLRCPPLQLRRRPAPAARYAGTEGRGRSRGVQGCWGLQGGCGCPRAGQSWALRPHAELGGKRKRPGSSTKGDSQAPGFLFRESRSCPGRHRSAGAMGPEHPTHRPSLPSARSSRLRQHAPSPPARARLEPRIQPGPRLLLPMRPRRDPPGSPLGADLPPGAVASRAGAEPAPERGGRGPRLPAPRLGLRSGDAGSGPRPRHRQPVHPALTGAGTRFRVEEPWRPSGYPIERTNVPRFFLLVRDDYSIFARKGVIFHSSTGVLPLFGLLKGLFMFIFVVIIKAFSLLFTHAALACVPARPASRRRARSPACPRHDSAQRRNRGLASHPWDWRKENKKKGRGEGKVDYELMDQLLLWATQAKTSPVLPPQPELPLPNPPAKPELPELRSHVGRRRRSPSVWA